MSEYTNLKALLKLKTTKHVDFAAAFLESRGFRFCVDFGYQNAVEKAASIMTAELESVV